MSLTEEKRQQLWADLVLSNEDDDVSTNPTVRTVPAMRTAIQQSDAVNRKKLEWLTNPPPAEPAARRENHGRHYPYRQKTGGRLLQHFFFGEDKMLLRIPHLLWEGGGAMQDSRGRNAPASYPLKPPRASDHRPYRTKHPGHRFRITAGVLPHHSVDSPNQEGGKGDSPGITS